MAPTRLVYKLMVFNASSQLEKRLHHGQKPFIGQDQVVLITARMKRQAPMLKAKIMEFPIDQADGVITPFVTGLVI
ncbi:hypothetical protein ASD86_25090 [Lysobacter sp. Root690]|nr:hypothetical protein ASD86_25090 [Lysobacter sp. Root690]